MRRTAKPPPRPKVGDPIVDAGQKYRIYVAAPDQVFFKQRFGGRTGCCANEKLRWDKVAGVWRTGR